MAEYRVTNKTDAHEMIRAANADSGRDDTPYTYGAAIDPETNEQTVYFDLPRVSPLQFNVSTRGITERQGLIAKIKAAIEARLTVESDESR